MAAQNLPSFPLPGFSQLIPALIERQITVVNRVLAQSELGTCDYEDPDFNFYGCCEKATVHHIAFEQEYCLRHFQKVNRG